MLAYGVLGSIGLLLALLVRGRTPPAILFTAWATIYYLAGLIDQRVFLSSFTNPALATLVVLLMASLVLERSPVLDSVSGLIIRGGASGATLRLSSITATFSAFVNNTAVVGSMLGMITRQRRIPASRLLIPLSYASILGGVTTLVGTSTNLVVSSFAVNAGLPALSMFQFSWVGIPVAVVCIAVLVVAGRWLPDNESDDRSNGQSYFLEAQVQADSPLVGHSIEENRLRRLDGLFLAEILRHGRLISPVGPDEVLEAEDMLIFSGETRKVQSLQQFPGLKVFGAQTDKLLGANLVEVVVANESVLANRTLRDVDFRTMFDAAVVGIRRGEKRLTGQLGQIRLHVGDSLLLAVGSDFRQHRNLDRNFHVLDGSVQRPRLSSKQNFLALSGFCSVISLSAVDWLPLLDGLLILLALFLVGGLLSLGNL
jgi:di/tricarboxylate transporter